MADIDLDAIHFGIDADGDYYPLAAPKGMNYPAEVNTRLDVVYGYDNQFTGLLDIAGEAPAAPIVSVSSDGSNVVWNISGTTETTSNLVFVCTSGGVWAQKGSRTGNGIVTAELSTGIYWTLVRSVTPGGSSCSLPIRFSVKEGLVEKIHSPAQIFVKMLQDFGWMTSPQLGQDWPVFISFLPDGPGVVGKSYAAVYDTVGARDGRLSNGEHITHPGIQLRVRTLKFQDGWEKLQLICSEVSKIRAEVELDDRTYSILNVSRTSDVLPLGMEDQGKKRFDFSVNFIITTKEV